MPTGEAAVPMRSLRSIVFAYTPQLDDLRSGAPHAGTILFCDDLAGIFFSFVRALGKKDL